MLNFIKGLVVNEQGGLKWGSIIGAAAGAFLLPSVFPFLGNLGIIGTIAGGAVGLLGGNLISGLFSGSSPAPISAMAPQAGIPKPEVPDMQIRPQLSTPGMAAGAGPKTGQSANRTY